MLDKGLDRELVFARDVQGQLVAAPHFLEVISAHRHEAAAIVADIDDLLVLGPVGLWFCVRAATTAAGTVRIQLRENVAIDVRPTVPG